MPPHQGTDWGRFKQAGQYIQLNVWTPENVKDVGANGAGNINPKQASRASQAPGTLRIFKQILGPQSDFPHCGKANPAKAPGIPRPS
jgi:hypothetical protein